MFEKIEDAVMDVEEATETEMDNSVEIVEDNQFDEEDAQTFDKIAKQLPKISLEAKKKKLLSQTDQNSLEE